LIIAKKDCGINQKDALMGLVRIAQLMKEAVDGYENGNPGVQVAGIYNTPPTVHLTGPGAQDIVIDVLGGRAVQSYKLDGDSKIKYAAEIENVTVMCLGVE
jgi:hypothetical protein